MRARVWNCDSSVKVGLCGATGALTVQLITTSQGMAELTPEWERLDAGISPRMPFTTPLWSALWWRHYQRHDVARDDQLNLYAVRDSSGVLIGVAPMMISARPASGPFRMRELQFLGADTNVTELRGLVCQPQDQPRVVEALRLAMAEQAGGWDWVQWRGLRHTAQTPDWQAEIPGLQPIATVTDHYVKLPATWDALKAGLPRNLKESLRKCYNSLAREGHVFEFRVVADPVAVTAAIGRFLALHAGRAEVTGSVDHLDVFAVPPAQAFLHDYALAMAERGQFRVFELVIGGQVVASRLAMLLGSEMYLYFSGYDSAWGRYSVMTTVVAEAIQWAIGQGLAIVNLSTGTDVSKTRWRPDSVSYTDGFEVAPNRRSAIAFGVMRRVRQAAGA